MKPIKKSWKAICALIFLSAFHWAALPTKASPLEKKMTQHLEAIVGPGNIKVVAPQGKTKPAQTMRQRKYSQPMVLSEQITTDSKSGVTKKQTQYIYNQTEVIQHQPESRSDPSSVSIVYDGDIATEEVEKLVKPHLSKQTSLYIKQTHFKKFKSLFPRELSVTGWKSYLPYALIVLLSLLFGLGLGLFWRKKQAQTALAANIYHYESKPFSHL